MHPPTSRPPAALPIDRLTSARFFAALWVLMMHFTSVGALGPADEGAYGTFLRFWLATGGSAVGFFFVLSGFILAHTYATRMEAGGPAERARFWRARVARIYPTYLLALGLTTMSALTLGRLGAPPWNECTLPGCGGAWLLSLVPVQSWFPSAQVQQLWNAPGWSIATEAFFYALFPWLLGPAMAFTRRWGWAAIGAFWLAQNLMFLALGLLISQASPEWQAGLGWWQERLPLLRLPEFLMGIAAWTLYSERVRAGGGSAPRAAWLLALVVLLGAIWYLPMPETAAWWRIPLSGKAYLLAAPMFALLVVWLALSEGRAGPGRLLASRPLVALGQSSYCLYITHWFGLQALFIVCRPWGAPPAWAGYLAVLLLVAGSLLVHRYFERPMQRRLLAPRPGTDRQPGTI